MFCCCFAWFYVVNISEGGGVFFFKLFSLFFFSFLLFWLAFAEEVVDMTIRSLFFFLWQKWCRALCSPFGKSVTHLLYAVEQKTSVFGRLFSPLIYAAKQRFYWRLRRYWNWKGLILMIAKKLGPNNFVVIRRLSLFRGVTIGRFHCIRVQHPKTYK